MCPSESMAEILIGIEKLFVTTQAKKFISGSSLIALFQSHAILLQKKFASLGSISVKWAQVHKLCIRRYHALKIRIFFAIYNFKI